MREHEYRSRIRNARIARDEDERNRKKRAALYSCVMMSIMLLLCCMAMVWPSYATQEYSSQEHSSTNAECKTLMGWPLQQTKIVGQYDAPDQPWLPGHRGVDLLTSPQNAILAPADGSIAFSGVVAGKSVVTIRHDGSLSNLTSTFEPAVAEKKTGTHVSKGERFAHVEGNSDHCADQCLHWGLKAADHSYADPTSKAKPMRVGLKSG